MNQTHTNDSQNLVHFDQQLRLVEQIVLATIFISALISNTLVLIVVLKTRQRRTTRMAFFILYLTIADLLVAFFSVLPMLIWKTTPTFFGENFLCRSVTFLMLTSTYISVYTLVVMAIDRYQAIVHPLSTYTWTSRTGLFHMIIVWCASIILALPQLVIFRSVSDSKTNTKYCMAKFLGPDRTWELIYIGWTIIVQFVLPVCILLFCYGSVYLIVNRNFSMYRLSDNLKTTSIANLPSVGMSKNFSNLSASTITIDPSAKKSVKNHISIHFPSVECSSITSVTFFNKSPSIMYPVVFRLRRSSVDSTSTNVQHPTSMSFEGQKVKQRYGASHFLSRARLKTIKLTFIVVLAYILCSTPFYVGSIIMVLNNKFLSQKTMNWLMTIFTLLFNLNSCSNPIICLTLSSTLFRRKQNTKQPLVVSRKSQTVNEQKTIDKNHPKHFLSL